MITVIAVLAMIVGVQQQEYRPVDFNVPEVVQERAEREHLFEKYRVRDAVNPFYLRGDFDGDGKLDYAVLVESKTNHKRGIALFLTSQRLIRVLGAGTKFTNAGDDFAWMDAWSVYGKRPVERGADEGPPPKLIAEAILVEKSESASALIYWDGKTFRWYQQGD
jgi:hypothetical protein